MLQNEARIPLERSAKGSLYIDIFEYTYWVASKIILRKIMGHRLIFGASGYRLKQLLVESHLILGRGRKECLMIMFMGI